MKFRIKYNAKDFGIPVEYKQSGYGSWGEIYSTFVNDENVGNNSKEIEEVVKKLIIAKVEKNVKVNENQEFELKDLKLSLSIKELDVICYNGELFEKEFSYCPMFKSVLYGKRHYPCDSAKNLWKTVFLICSDLFDIIDICEVQI